MSAELYKTYPLPTLATLAADDLNRFYSDRKTSVPAVTELMDRLQAASLPLALPSVSVPVISSLRLSSRGGLTVSSEAIRELSAFTAERLKLAIKAQPPEHEYKYLIGLCLRMADSGSEVASRTAPALAVQPAARP